MTRYGCARHDYQCAYDGTETGRCSSCHCTWTVILACACPDCGTRENHLAVHARRDAARRKDVLRKRGKAPARDPEGRHGTGELSRTIPGTPRPPEAADSVLGAP